MPVVNNFQLSSLLILLEQKFLTSAIENKYIVIAKNNPRSADSLADVKPNIPEKVPVDNPNNALSQKIELNIDLELIVFFKRYHYSENQENIKTIQLLDI